MTFTRTPTSHVFALLMGFTIVGNTAARAQPVPAREPKQWTINWSAAKSNTSYGFTNLYNNSTLAIRANAPGLHVYWDPPGGIGAGGATWVFMKRDADPNVRDHRKRPIADGEKVALYTELLTYRTPRGVRRGQYLVYSSSSNTSQLKWQTSATNTYEWVAAIDPATKRMSLYNTRKRSFLVFDRANKIGWVTQPGQGMVHDATVTMTAQPVTRGFLPFLGYFGGGVNFSAVLTEVRNASNAYLSFVKPGRSTQDCGNANAVIVVAPNTPLTAAQMTTLYGSATPSLQNRIAFLACAGTNASSVFLNIKYRDV